MEIKTRTEGDKLIFAVSGRVDTVTAPELEAGLKFADATCVVLDLADVPYMSSAGLRVLLSAQKRMNKQGSMKLLHVNDTVKEVFDITGFADFLTIE